MGLPEMTLLTAEDLQLDQVLLRISSGLSIMGSLAIITSFLAFKSFRIDSNRLVFYMSWYDLIGALSTCLGSLGFAHGTSSLFCQLQATFLHIGLLGGVLWSGCMALNLVLKFSLNRSLEDLRSIEVLYNAAIFIITWVPAFSMLILSANGMDLYGSATLWCWISSEFSSWRIYLFYLPIWVCILFNFLVYIYVFFKLRAMSTKFHLNSTVLVSYARHSSFFVLAALLTWCWGSIVRVQGMVDPTNQVPWLFAMHAIFTPLNGFVNFLVYAATSPEMVRRFKQTVSKGSVGSTAASSRSRITSYISDVTLTAGDPENPQIFTSSKSS
ncbi:hypothetical protein HDV03_003824 [Kappamyces sp. JEL0829]|nr:hypothetical protein HDV03_003824 [Kappamyces sp. JEL0829]